MFSDSKLENSRFIQCNLKMAVFAEVKLKHCDFTDVNLSGADFFKTSLKNIDLSTCEIAGITVSDSFRELKGLRINPAQAQDIAGVLGVKFI